MSDWSPHGLVFRRSLGIWLIDPRQETDERLLVDEVARPDGWPTFSPDGRWLAYATRTREDSIPQVFVVPFPGGAPVYRVTAEGGTRPAWSRSGDRLFFRTGANNFRNTMMAVAVTIDGDDIRFSDPQRLFDREFAGSTHVRSYDVAEDGRFLTIGNIEHAQKPVNAINIVLNWFAVGTTAA